LGVSLWNIEPHDCGGIGDHSFVRAGVVGDFETALDDLDCPGAMGQHRQHRRLVDQFRMRTPILTSTCIESTGNPTASATLSELCQSASRNARTAALV
jgi:hypothetical protein